MERIGILGGTFDPPHIGHLIIADEVRHHLKLDAIWFIPTNVPPHKRETSISPQHRLKMVKLATSGNNCFHVDSIEIDRNKTSYTIDTIKILQTKFPQHKFYFIIGADMVEYLPHWKGIDQLLSLTKFVGVKRTNYTLNSAYPIIEVTIPTIDISSTEIRDRLKHSLPAEYLLPNHVYEYIKEYQLYGSK